MAKATFKRDSSGIREFLQTDPGVRREIDAAARRVAAGVPMDTTVDAYTTDRAAAAVTVKDRRGAAEQAKRGVLTRAAAAAGLEVTVKGPGW